MIVTVTLNPSIDISCHCPHVSPDRKLRCGEVRLQPGGGGINVCRVVQELGGQASAVWLSGGDSGRTLQHLLDDEGVPGDAVEADMEVRHSLYVAEDASDRAYRFVLPGPEVSEKTLDCVARHIEGLDDVEYLVLSGSVPPGLPADCYSRLSESTPEARVVLDTSGPALKRTVDAGVFLVKPNLRELSELGGKGKLGSDAAVADAAGQVLDAGRAEYVLVSLGAGGALLRSAEETIRLRAPTVEVRSAVGAGDSMVAGAVLAFAQGRSARQAARLAVAAGSAAVMTPGTELCRREDVERIYDEMSPAE